MSSALGRNDPCHCGSGRKYKNCCQKMGPSETTGTSKVILIVLAAVVLIGLVLVGISLTEGGGRDICPPGTVWSAAHQHCH